MTAKWAAFPYPEDEFAYEDEALKTHWGRLHRGDREPFPSAQWVAQTLASAPKAKHGAARPDAVASALQEAWRAYHRGDFQQACEAGVKLGPLGFAVANKAAGIYAVYLAPSEAVRLKLLEEAAARAEQARSVLPEHANSHYLLAYCLGRYSQGISVVKALAQGLGGRVKRALDRAVELQPEHAEAHTAIGTYHAEVIDKVGALVGGLTYGASKDEALAHYRKALQLHPKSAIARVEYAAGLLLLDRAQKGEAKKLLAQAGKLEPADAMERLDVELARTRLREP